jgi:hypothetical protein
MLIGQHKVDDTSIGSKGRAHQENLEGEHGRRKKRIPDSRNGIFELLHLIDD